MPLSVNYNGRQSYERSPLVDSSINNVPHLSYQSILLDKSSTIPTGVSWGVAAFLLVNTALGAGMLNYPYAYNQIGGVLAASLIQVVLLVFIASTMFILVYCADINQDDSYHDVLMSMCGKRAQQISAFSIFLTCYGINVTFLVIIGDQYDRIFDSLLANQVDEYWFLDRKFTIFATAVLFIWPMCYAKRLDFLRHASIVGLFAMLYVAFLTVYEHYKLDESTINTIIQNSANSHHNSPTSSSTNNTTTNPTTKKLVQWFEPLAIVPILCFAYQTHEVIVPVYACLKQRSISHFMKASIFGLVILFFLYNLVGAFGYLTFGANVGADIMSYYDAKDPVVVVGIVALVIKFITTYPPLMFCGRGALDGLYGEIRKLSKDQFESSERVRRFIISTIWFFSTVLLAVFAPDISVTLQLLGSMASINVFVFPGMCLISLARGLRRARMALLIEDDGFSYNNLHQQRAKDYYLTSGRDFSAMKRKQYNLRATAVENNYNQKQAKQQPQHFTATFADLMELDKQNSNNFDIHQQHHRHHHNHHHHEHHIHQGFNIDSRSNNRQQALQNNSWQNNRSLSVFDRLGSSIAPSTVAQIGISKFTALGLYLFSAVIILFGSFIFVLELVTVLGFVY